MSKLGKALAQGTAVELAKIPEDQALYLFYYGQMGKVGYTNLRLSMLPHGVIFPTYNELSDYKFRNIVPSQLVYNIFTNLIPNLTFAGRI